MALRCRRTASLAAAKQLRPGAPTSPTAPLPLCRYNFNLHGLEARSVMLRRNRKNGLYMVVQWAVVLSRVGGGESTVAVRVLPSQ